MERAASYFSNGTDADGDTVCCQLCPRACSIPGGSLGTCKVRGNINGRGQLPFYGYVTALASDPIEKKPLYHFRPGSRILSAGFAGCNFHCPFCQNWRLSQSTESPGRWMRPDELVSAAIHDGSRSIAYTYSEPLVHVEYLLDCMALVRQHAIANVLVTNGCINAEAAGEILSLADAANIDLKCFSRDGYVLLGGNLDTVCAFIRLALEKSVHTEITTLVVPGFNDSPGELDACAGFIASLHADSGLPRVPWHLSAYRPEFRWSAPPTNPDFLLQAKKRAAAKLPYVYTGNIQDDNDTHCLHCHATLVSRRGYRTDTSGLEPPPEGERYYRCALCKNNTSIRG